MAQHSLDAKRLAAARAEAERLPDLRAYLVLQHGRVLDELYSSPHTAASKSHVRSITKSVTSALVGIAIEQGQVDGVDVPIARYLPEYAWQGDDARKRHMTLRHLLTMTAAFAWDEEAEAATAEWFFGGRQAALYDALARPLAHTPGTTFNYDSPAADLAGAVLARAIGRDLRSFADDTLFGPLEIADDAWEVDPAGFYRASAGLELRARDVAKIGQLYLQQGQWQGQRQGRQVIPEAWVAQSTQAQVPLGDGAGYGLLWWLRATPWLQHFSAVGFGGQLLLVVPAQQLVVVAQQEWWQIPAERAVQNQTSFYNDVFLPLVGAGDAADDGRV